MFVNKTRVRDITRENVKFTTIRNVVYQKVATLFKSLCSIKIVYTNKNIFIKTFSIDNRLKYWGLH